MDPVERPLAFDELQRELLERVYRFMMQLRFVIAPLPLVFGSIVVVVDHSAWRRFTLATVFVSAIVLSILEDLHVQRRGTIDLKRVALVVGAVLQPAVVIATGGILSPIIFAMLMIDFVASTILEKRFSRLLVLLQVADLLVATVLEHSQLIGPLLPDVFRMPMGAAFSPYLLWVSCTVATLVFLVTHALGLRIQAAFGDLLLRTTRARDDTLRMHGEQMAELTQLSGEIAHELKNPLASIKGLAALLARRSQGNEPEALVVLRREVDRMQAVLEEFLNFSRPLVPLSVSTADLVAITGEVCAMHFGISEVRNISLSFEPAESLEVQCDARKVRQILVNLLQNALEATPELGKVSVRVQAKESEAVVVIEDTGPGLDSAIRARAFQAGTTTKPDGSGLGLNVARGLARQHGGEVTLINRAEGGCQATLHLPYRISNISTTET